VILAPVVHELLRLALSFVGETCKSLSLRILICSEPMMGIQNSTGTPPFVTGTKVTECTLRFYVRRHGARNKLLL